MDEPQYCSVCQRPLRRIKHAMAHAGSFTWQSEMRTCPHNLHSPHRYEDPRHDEWHHCDVGWVKREF